MFVPLSGLGYHDQGDEQDEELKCFVHYVLLLAAEVQELLSAS